MTIRRRDEILVCHMSIGKRNYACYQKEDTRRMLSRMMQQRGVERHVSTQTRTHRLLQYRSDPRSLTQTDLPPTNQPDS